MQSISPVSNIFAVIVTYNGDWANVIRLTARLVESGARYVIVDNGSDERSGLAGLNTILLDENRGIAEAQNIGIQHCLDAGASVVVFFDQDSVIKDGFIFELMGPIVDGSAKITAPVFYDIQKGFGYPIVKISKSGLRTRFAPADMRAPLETNVAISSGTAATAEVFAAVGLMDPKLFIDYVDTEWCLRCDSKGYSVFVNPLVRMDHSIGDRSIQLFGVTVPVHSPLRRYYRIRNALLLLRIPHVPKVLALREVTFSIVHQLIIILSARGKRIAYINYMCKGVWHGIINRAGRY